MLDDVYVSEAVTTTPMTYCIVNFPAAKIPARGFTGAAGKAMHAAKPWCALTVGPAGLIDPIVTAPTLPLRH
jgi:hypothetical protein